MESAGSKRMSGVIFIAIGVIFVVMMKVTAKEKDQRLRRTMELVRMLLLAAELGHRAARLVHPVRSRDEAAPIVKPEKNPDMNSGFTYSSQGN